jgi:hypothetical protein
MPLKKAFDTTALAPLQKENMDDSPLAISVTRRGVQGDNLYEPIPNYNRNKCETVYEGANNSSIVLGKDRPGEAGSGYGSETGAGTIDIVAGRVSSDIRPSIANRQSRNVESLFVDPNIAKDASRIYISQKTDVDKNFALAPGVIGNSEAKAAIAIKSDAVRLIGREGVKIVSGVDAMNSHGAPIVSVPGVEIITGNDDTNLQPIPQGDDLNKVISDLMERVDELNSTLDYFMTKQMEYNVAIMKHDHISPIQVGVGTIAGNPLAINKGKTSISPSLIIAGGSAFGNHSVAKFDGIASKLKLTLDDLNSNTPFGVKQPSSNNVKTT